MYEVQVRAHVMIAHSFRGEVFGPAQAMHGATYLVDVCCRRADLDPDGLVVDIGLLTREVERICALINFRNLDEMPEFAGVNTTTEFLARWVFDRVADGVAEGRLGPHASGLAALRVTLHESHVALAAYDSPLPGRA